MTMCTDITCTEEFDFSGGVQMDQTIYMSMDAVGLDGNILTLVVEEAFATDNTGGITQRYDLVIDGCANPEHDTVKTVFNKNGGTIIAFQMFQFKGSNSGLDLGFKMKLCLTSDKKCMPQCSSKRKRKRRSSNSENKEDENVILVSVDWN
ncbi:hypothetical protein JOQ06_022600 [Pogonophryne albipinna]|uniref:ZP domain-containing protein n=1 Tax=Pogonophryne albipinna TaxID=1090488 RepID=A0AAD6F6U7_9TELE|nr:hypothetical protein JOQ06_022600 [Pogonophryne albipinna]